MKKTILFLMFLAYLFSFSQEYNFFHFSVSDGLSQSTVIAIEQDQFGQMWIGTRDGLNKYDGERVTIYRNVPSDSVSLSSNDILSIKEDDKGFIWIGTYNGLNRFDPKTRTFKRFLYSTEKNTNTHRSIRAIRQMKDKTLWFATSNGLFIHDGKNDDLLFYGTETYSTSAMPNRLIIDVFQDKENTIWLGTSSGLVQVVNKDVYNLEFKQCESIENRESSLFVQAINEDFDGNLIVGSKSKGIFKFNKNSHKYQQYNIPGIDNIANLDIRKLSYDKNLNLWIGTYRGLFVQRKKKDISHIFHQPGNPRSISKNSIKEIFVDRNGSVWLGTYYGGVNIWDIHNNNFHTFYKTNGNQTYPFDVVSAIKEDDIGNMYIATEGNGVTVTYPDGSTNVLVTKRLGKRLANTNIKSLCVEDEKLWIGTFKEGIKCFDLRTKKFEDQKHKQLKLYLEKTGIYAIKKIKNHLAFGTFGKGLILYNLETENILIIKNIPSDTTSLTNNKVRSIIPDINGNLWVGTDKGLNKVNIASFEKNKIKVEQYLFDSKTDYGHNIFCIYQNDQGQIFVGTRERGVLILNQNRFEEITPKLLDNKIVTAYSIVQDDEENLWISCNLGIVRYNLETQKSMLYNQNEGFLGNEFFNDSYLKSKNGNLYFGGVQGVSFFNPKNLKKNTYKSKVILTKLKINGKDQDEYISSTEKMILNYDENSFTFNFALPSYVNKTNKHYAYRLLGLNNEWKFTNSSEVSYTIQKPGDYIFQVKEANNQETWNNKPTELRMVVKAAPWKTTLAYMSYFVIICFILYQIYKNMKSKITLVHKLKSERLGNIRQEEINKSKLEFFTNISHDFRTPLTLILAPLQQLIDNYTGSKQMFEKLEVIERNAKQLLKLTNQLLDFRSYENKHTRLHVKNENIVPFAEEVYKSFLEYARIGKYSYSFKFVSDQIMLFYDQNQLEKVLYNLLSNAFRYTQKGGKIILKIEEDENHVVIVVSDNGQGINHEFMNKIFDRYYEVASQIEYQKKFNQGSGIGLHIAKKIIDLHKGEIEVTTKENIGTTFRVYLKKGSDHLESCEIEKDQSRDEGFTYENVIETVQTFELEYPASSSGDKPKILIAEDNDEFRKFMVDILKEHYQVEQADNGEDAFRKAIRVLPDMIVSDVIMPKMEGTELCAKIKNDLRTNHIPLVLLTSRASIEYKFKGLEVGADAYIDKPFNIKEFLLILKNLYDTTTILKTKFSKDDLSIDQNDMGSVEESLRIKAIKIVENNINDPSFDIPYFCSELGVSRTMLFIKIKAWTNLTPKEFVNSIRMKRASELLEMGELSISEIGYKVGFRDPKYFSKYFKKYFKRTPSEYAKKFHTSH